MSAERIEGMNSREIDAYNAGVQAVLALARGSSVVLARSLTKKPTRYNFAIGAFDAIADEGLALLLPQPPDPNEPLPAAFPTDPKPLLPAAAA